MGTIGICREFGCFQKLFAMIQISSVPTALAVVESQVCSLEFLCREVLPVIPILKVSRNYIKVLNFY